MKSFNTRIFAVIILLIFIISSLFLILNSSSASTATISSDGKVVKTVDLTKPQEFTITSSAGGTNTIKIENNQIWVIYADCPDKICINQGKRGMDCSNSTPIVCLPNRLSITVSDDK